MEAFRILSLDGGGIMGAFTASVLATLEEHTNQHIRDHFDLIAGTSTGGIIAIGLGMGKSARKICDFYRDEGPNIFPSGGFLGGWRKGLRHLLRPKFDSAPLRKAIGSVVGNAPLLASRLRLVIPAYDVDTGRVYVFKTAHDPRFVNEAKLSALDVALATSAAPTYFPAHHIPRHGTYIDGGVWANCPAMVGLTEALTFLRKDPRDVWILSVSTTNYPFHIADRKRLAGILGWNKTVIDTLMFGQAEGALRYAQNLLGGPISRRHGGRFHRIDYVAPPKLYSLDNAKMVTQLIEIGAGVARRAEHLDDVVRPHFLNGTYAPPFNLPVAPAKSTEGPGT
jgi:uncharacterized protein